MAILAAALLLTCIVQEKAPEVDQKAIDRAIEKGARFLTRLYEPIVLNESCDRGQVDLALLTLVHAGVAESDKVLQKLLDYALKKPLASTYGVSLQAIALEQIDRVAYQPRIAQCAQFLLDNQATNGQWSYGMPSPAADKMPTGSGGRPVPTPGGKRGPKPKVEKKVELKQRRTLPGGGDGSNTQYALLGLRACHDAGIVLPKEVMQRTRKFYVDSQCKDRGWGYQAGTRMSWGSMTSGALSSLVVCRYLLGEKWDQDEHVADGLKWLGDRFTVTENPGLGLQWHYYYLYGLERACILYSTERLGDRWWYSEGVKFLLAKQAADGSWGTARAGVGLDAPTDTCFAILFLRRAVDSLEPVPTVDEKPPVVTKERAATVYRERLEELRKVEGVKQVILGQDGETWMILVVLRSEAARKAFAEKYGGAIEGVGLRTTVE